MTIEKTVYFVRHGESEANAAPVFQHPDSPLSAKGREQAAKIAQRVSRLTFDTLLVSPFPRAKETAQAITAATGKQPEYSDLLIERLKPTSVNGKAYTDTAATTKWEQWEESMFTSGQRVEDGENFDDLIARADKIIDFLTKRPESSIVVITHGYILRTIVLRVLLGDLLTGEAFRRFQSRASIENTGLTVLRYYGTRHHPEPYWHLWTYNDHAHLG